MNTEELWEHLLRYKIGSLLESYKKVLEAIPADDLVVPTESVLSLLADYLESLSESRHKAVAGNFVRNLFSKAKADKLMRFYIPLAEQLEEDELSLLEYLDGRNVEIVDTMDLDRANNRFSNLKIEKDELPLDILTKRDLRTAYILHLMSLNLIEWPVYNQLPIAVGGTQTGIRRFSRIGLTELGKYFVSFALKS